MGVVLITGSNRGIGLELARRFSARGDRVIAACRIASEELRTLDVEIHEGVEVTDDAGVRRFAADLSGRKIDTLILNAGVLSHESLDDMDFADIAHQFNVNALGPLRIAIAMLDHLKKGAKIIVVTSRMGSIADNTSGGYYGYRMSKAAINAGAVSMAHDLKSRGIIVCLLHPGMVATEMTNHSGISVAQSAQNLIARIDESTMQHTGTFRHAEGQPLPW